MNLGESSVSASTPLFQSGSGGSTPTLSHQLIEKIKRCLSPDLLKKQYRAKNADNPTYGHCYIATEALFYSLNDSRYAPARGRDDSGVVHWWIVDRATGEILDPTAEQYTSQGLTPPYTQGRCGGFLTKTPSQRCKTLLARMQE